MIDVKKWETVEIILTENNIPEEFKIKLVDIVSEFEKKHMGLKESNLSAFNILLLGTVYKAGKESEGT